MLQSLFWYVKIFLRVILNSKRNNCYFFQLELSPEFEGVTLDILKDPKELAKQRKL